MAIIELIKESWVVIAGIIGGITLLWNFINKTLKEMSESFHKPLDDLNRKIDESNASDKLVKEALLTLQRRSLLDTCTALLKRGYADVNDKSALSDQYASYHALGGDQFITDMVKKVENLPFEKQKKTK